MREECREVEKQWKRLSKEDKKKEERSSEEEKNAGSTTVEGKEEEGGWEKKEKKMSSRFWRPEIYLARAVLPFTARDRCRKTQSAYLRGIIKSVRREWSRNPPENGKRAVTTFCVTRIRGLNSKIYSTVDVVDFCYAFLARRLCIRSYSLQQLCFLAALHRPTRLHGCWNAATNCERTVQSSSLKRFVHVHGITSDCSSVFTITVIGLMHR